MRRIMLACAGGMSSSLIVQKMREAAQKKGLDCKIWAVDVGAVENNLGEFDVLMLAPQIAYKKNSIKTLIGDIPFGIIEPATYGMCDGKKALKQAMELLHEN